MVDRGQMLLALVMGAGKTITTLSALETLKNQGEIKKALIVVPSSLKYQWEREIKKFTDSVCIVIDGTISTRKKQWRASLSATYVIINSESLKNDLADFEKHTFDAMVVDEATIQHFGKCKVSDA